MRLVTISASLLDEVPDAGLDRLTQTLASIIIRLSTTRGGRGSALTAGEVAVDDAGDDGGSGDAEALFAEPGRWVVAQLVRGLGAGLEAYADGVTEGGVLRSFLSSGFEVGFRLGWGTGLGVGFGVRPWLAGSGAGVGFGVRVAAAVGGDLSGWAGARVVGSTGRAVIVRRTSLALVVAGVVAALVRGTTARTASWPRLGGCRLRFGSACGWMTAGPGAAVRIMVIAIIVPLQAATPDAQAGRAWGVARSVGVGCSWRTCADPVPLATPAPAPVPAVSLLAAAFEAILTPIAPAWSIRVPIDIPSSSSVMVVFTGCIATAVRTTAMSDFVGVLRLKALNMSRHGSTWESAPSEVQRRNGGIMTSEYRKAAHKRRKGCSHEVSGGCIFVEA